MALSPHYLTRRDLTSPESRLWDALARWDAVHHHDKLPAPEEAVNLAPGEPAQVDVSTGATWGSDRQVRADLIRQILLGRTERCRPRKLVLAGARITGRLDLEHLALACHLKLVSCYFDDKLVLDQTEASGIYLINCHIPSIEATQLHTRHSFKAENCTIRNGVTLIGARIDGQLVLRNTKLLGVSQRYNDALAADALTVGRGMYCDDGFRSEGLVSLVGAQIGGRLKFDGARLRNAGGTALHADELVVAGTLLMAPNCEVVGAVLLNAARLGELECAGAQLNHGTGTALQAVGLQVAQSVRFNNGFRAVGGVDITNCRIGGRLDCTRGEFIQGGGRPALEMSRARVEQNMVCRTGFRATGMVLLDGADIRGDLRWEGGRFVNDTGVAISAEGVRVGRNARLAKIADTGSPHAARFQATGSVVLADSEIGGQLDCQGGSFDGKGEPALSAPGLIVGNDLLLANGFHATGTVSLIGAEVRGHADWSGGRFHTDVGAVAVNATRLVVHHNLDFGNRFSAVGSVVLDGSHIKGKIESSRASLRNPNGEALSASRVEALQGIRLLHRFAATGTVNLESASIGVELKIDGAKLTAAGGTLLNLRGAEITGTLRLAEPSEPTDNGEIDLSYARVLQLEDTGFVWPARTRLDHFTYETLEEGDQSLTPRRKTWLSSSPGTQSRQVYQQLAKVYRAAGKSAAAREVLVAGEDARAKELPNPLRRGLRRLLRWTIGYGHHPFWIIRWFVGAWALGGLLFYVLDCYGQIALANNLDGIPSCLERAQGSIPACPPDHTNTTANTPPSFFGWVYSLDLLLPVVSLGQRAVWFPLHGWVWVTSLFTCLGWIFATTLVYGLSRAIQRE
ncbi:hypothetical protein [Streptomyces griseoruber]|uniref:hypothetical protein n=1 Tax=Streptomyces griseoruber TaxID=1943 RepID=UPI0006E377EE|nr:hypothetical protein [Streptomyces griseoruber]